MIEEGIGGPVNGQFSPPQGIFSARWSAGCGILSFRHGNDRGVQFAQGLRLDQGRITLSLAGIPPGPARKIKDRHVGDPGRANNGRAVTIGTGEKGLHLSIDQGMPERRIDFAE